ncbi:hypothetical protein HD554DRAFT_2170232 [Boletus coccyginus]|nr:hypothetical protein HD554DRAFT_2170232 [Boletus coccyginus]
MKKQSSATLANKYKQVSQVAEINLLMVATLKAPSTPSHGQVASSVNLSLDSVFMARSVKTVHINISTHPAMLATPLSVHQSRVPAASSGAAGTINKQTEYQHSLVNTKSANATNMLHLKPSPVLKPSLVNIVLKNWSRNYSNKSTTIAVYASVTNLNNQTGELKKAISSHVFLNAINEYNAEESDSSTEVSDDLEDKQVDNGVFNMDSNGNSEREQADKSNND